MSSQDYLTKNAGVITASKLKAFMFCEKQYEYEYRLGMGVEDEIANYFLQGQCLEDYMFMSRKKWEAKWIIMGKGKKRPKETSPDVNYLTFTDGKAVLSAIKEINRHPEFDIEGDYEIKVDLRAGYQGYVIGGELDRFSLEKKLIRDYKFLAKVTSANRDISQKGRDYLFSMSFYQLLVDIEYEVKCHAKIDIFDKNVDYSTGQGEPMSRARSLTIPKDVLLDERARVIDALQRYIKADKSGKFEMAEPNKRINKCCACKFYPICPGAVQQAEEFYDPHLRSWGR